MTESVSAYDIQHLEHLREHKQLLENIFGFQNMTARSDAVENALEERRNIYQAIDSISNIQEKALLCSFGVSLSDYSSSSDPESETDCEADHIDHDSNVEFMVKILKTLIVTG